MAASRSHVFAGRLWAAAFLAGALVLAALAYGRSLDGELQFDDATSLERAPLVRDLGAAARAVLSPALLGPERRLTTLTFAVDHALAGLSPRRLHLTGLLLHLATALVAWLLAARLASLAGLPRAREVAAVAAGIFAVHPLQVQAVAYAAQRAEVLASLLYAAALLLLLEAEARRRSGWGGAAWAGALAAFALALGAKPVAVTLPAAWLLVALVAPGPEARQHASGWRDRLLRVVPFVALAAWHAVLTLGAISGPTAGPDAGFSVPGLPPATYLLTQLRVVLTYLRLLAWPMDQSIDWDVTPSASLLEPRTLAAAAALLALVAGAAVAAWRSRRETGPAAAAARLAALGLGWFLLLLAPTSSVVPLADLLVEHRVYLASLGPILAACAAGSVALERLGPRGPKAGAALAVAALLLAGGATWTRTGLWRTQLELWADAAAKAPARARPRAQVALALQRQGRLPEALEAYAAARQRLRPGEEALLVQLARNEAVALVAAGRPEEAVTSLEEARRLAPRNAELLTNLCLAQLSLGRLDEAERAAGEALAAAPGLPEAHGLAGSVRLRRGDPVGAEAAFRRAVDLAPAEAGHRFNLGVALERQGRVVEACTAWAGAVALPADPGTAARLGAVLARRCR